MEQCLEKLPFFVDSRYAFFLTPPPMDADNQRYLRATCSPVMYATDCSQRPIIMSTKPVKPIDDSVSASASKSGSVSGSSKPGDPGKKVIMLGRFRLLSVLGQGAMGKVV